MNTFGLTPFIPPTNKSGNIYVDFFQAVAEDQQTRFDIPFAVNSRNLSVFINGTLLGRSEWSLVPSIGYQASELVLNDPLSLNDQVFVSVLLERAGESYTRRQYVYVALDPITDDTYFEVDFEYNPIFTTIYKNGSVLYMLDQWHQEGTVGVRLNDVYVDGDKFLVVEDVPNTQNDLRVDWTAIDNIPPEFLTPPTEPVVKGWANEVISDIFKSDQPGLGADYIIYEGTTTVKEVIADALDGAAHAVDKRGDTGLGEMTGDGYTLSSKNRYYKLFQDGLIQFSGIKSNNNGDVVITVNGTDVCRITGTGIEHNSYGKLEDQFFPKSGMLLHGIGSYVLWANVADEGTILTPPGMTGSWKVMSSIYRDSNNKTCLLIRVL